MASTEAKAPEVVPAAAEVPAVAAPAEAKPSEGKPSQEKKVKTPKEKKPKAAKGSKTTPIHPPYFQMIKEAISALKEKGGSSPRAIAKFMEEKHKDVLPPNYKKMLAVQLKKLAVAGKLTKVKASFKLAEGAKKAPVKKVVKKSAKPKTASKPKEGAAAAKSAKPKAAKPKAAKKPAKAPAAPAAKPSKASKPAAPAKKSAVKKPAAAKPVKAKKPKSIKSPAKRKAPAKAPAAKKVKKAAN